jgi:hypothetical protein
MGRKRKSEVEQVEPQEQATDSGVSVEESASNEAAKEEAPPVEATDTPAVEPIAPPVMPTSGRSLDEIGHELAHTDGEKRDLESQKSDVMKDYNKRIGVLDARCAELAAEYLAAERPETYDYKAGLKYVWDGRTGKLLETISLGSMVQLPLVERPQQPPRATFQELVDGKVWEHEEHGFVRILAVLEDSVRVQTEDLDEDEAGIEIGRADWDATRSHPREVPELEIGQRWVVDDRELTITVLDDRSACVTWSDTEEPGRVARLSFCGATHVGANAGDDDADVTATVRELAPGQHWRLPDDGTDHCKLVTIVMVLETRATVRWAHSGSGGSVPLADFAGATPATEEEIEAALIPDEQPAKRSRKRAAGAEV